MPRQDKTGPAVQCAKKGKGTGKCGGGNRSGKGKGGNQTGSGQGPCKGGGSGKSGARA